MNPTLELNFWARLVGILALEIVLVVALAFLAQSLIRSVFWRRTIWQISFVCLLLLAGAELTGVGRGFSIWIAGKPVPERTVSVRIVPTDEQFIPSSMDFEIPEPVFIPQKETPIAQSIWWPGILWTVGLGLIVARIFFARVLFVVLRLRNRRMEDLVLVKRVYELAQRLGIVRRIRLLESPGLTSPVAFGIVQPSIGLPLAFAKKFNPAQQNAMLTHELAHLAARDPFWYLLADCAAAIFWWHPAIWFARRRLHSASEHAADEAAAILENGPGTLAECLVNLGRQLSRRRSFGWLGVEGNGFRSHLGQRVERLLNLKEAHRPLRGWKIFFAKTSFTILFAAVVIFTSGWIQNKDAQRPKSWKSAFQQSWNSSFVSLAVIALAENKTESASQFIPPETAETQISVAYENVSFDTVFFEAISTERLEFWSRTLFDSEDDEDVVILSSNQLRRVLHTFSEIPHTYDFVGRKFSGGHFFYQGSITNGRECSYLTEKENGAYRVKGAEMTYTATNLWSFSFVPQKLESSVQIDLKWPNKIDELAGKFVMPVDGGAIVRRAVPGDPTQQQLILFSSVRVLPKTQIEKDTKIAVATLVQDGKLLFEMGKFDEAEAKLNEALKIDAENNAAFYYKSLIKKAKQAQPRSESELLRPTIPPTRLDKTVVDVPHSPAPDNSAAPRDLVYTSKGRQAIKAKLDRIRFKQIEFDCLPLGEVLKVLRDESKTRDVDGVGINFMFNPHENHANPRRALTDGAYPKDCVWVITGDKSRYDKRAKSSEEKSGRVD